MKKALSVILKIAAVLLAFSILTLLFMPKYIEKNADGRITAEYYREKTDIDVIFVGSSTVHSGVSPMTLYKEYGISSYTRSNSSQVIALSYYMAEDAVKRNKPKLVVCDVGFIYQDFDFVDEGASRKALDSMRWSKSKSDAIKELMDESENYIDYVFPILRFHSRWNDLSSEDLKYLIYKPSVTYNGQLLRFDTVSPDVDYNPYMLEEGTVAGDENMAYLKKLCELCKNNDIDLLFIKMPMIEGNYSRSLDKQVSDFASENGTLYHNFIEDFDEIGLTKDEFADGHHLNSIGAEKYSKVLGQYIKDNYDIPDVRQDAKIKAVFDKKLDKYENAIKNRIPSEADSVD